MKDSDVTRAKGAYGQPGDGPRIIRVGSVLISSETYQNRRLAWSGSSYLPTTEVIVFYEPTNVAAPKQLGANDETWVIWREAANRWEEIGAGSSGNVIYAQVNSSGGDMLVNAGDPTFLFDNAVAIIGELPTAGAGTAQNQYGQEFANDEWVILYQRQDNSQWLTERGGTAGSTIIHFELTQDKGYDDERVLAKPVLPDGTLDSGADTFYVIDPMPDGDGMFYGLAEYTDSNTAALTHRGYRGFAQRIIDDVEIEEEPTGKSGWRIIAMEGPADELIVGLQASYSLGGTHCLIVADIGGPWGEPFGARFPLIEDDDYTLTVYDDLDIASAAAVSDLWVIRWHREDEHYTFWRPVVVEIASMVRGLAMGAVASSDTDFEIDNLVLIQGVLPGSPLTVENTFDWTIADNAPVVAVKDSGGTWIPIQALASCP